MRSTDAGETWADTGGNESGFVYFVSPMVGFRRGGDLYRTTDGGTTWTSVDAGIYQSICVLGNGRGWVVGNSGVMKYTVDMGATWAAASLPAFGGVDLNSVCGAIKSDGSIVACAVGNLNGGAAVILRTDNGMTWTTVAGGGSRKIFSNSKVFSRRRSKRGQTARIYPT